MKKRDSSSVLLSDLLEPGIGYFGMELWISPRSEAFRKGCIRTPDVICSIAPQNAHRPERWLVLWKSWENGASSFGAVESDVDYDLKECAPGCSEAPPLSIVLHCLAEQGMITERFVGIIATGALHSAGRADVRWDVPYANLRFIWNKMPVHGTQLRLYTPEQLEAYYSGCTLKRQPLLRIPPALLVRWARIFLTRAKRIASLIASEEDYHALRAAYREAHLNGALLTCCVSLGADLDELEELRADGNRIFSGIIFRPWYAGSALQREQHPTGLVILHPEDRSALYDFTPNRRWMLQPDGNALCLLPTDAESDALPYDPSTGYHELPQDIPLFLKLEDETLRHVYL